jgi:glycosyltransferase involved in cell wall biosynthesis
MVRILELTNYSAGVCGVWQRVKQEAELLADIGNEVFVFSSNHTKGSEDIAPAHEIKGKVSITRFPARKRGGESYLDWDFEKKAIELRPDVIIAHGYRHLHTTRALQLKKRFKCKVFLVTHAPFIKGNITRSFKSKIAVILYDIFKGPRTLKKFDKVIAITRWELPYLLKLKVPKDRIAYLPNGIPHEFFTKNKSTEKEGKILFLGRVSPIKNLDILIDAIGLAKNENIHLDIVGPAEEPYLTRLQGKIYSKGLSEKISFLGPIYGLNEKIRKIDEAKLFILPSIREAMPQSLIEAMSREKIVIASSNLGTRDLISHGKNGFLFQQGNVSALADLIDKSLNIKNKKELSEIKHNARLSVQQFNWSTLIRKLERIIL